MRTATFVFLLAAACSSAVPRPASAQARAPQSLDEAIRAQGYASLPLAPVARHQSFELGKAPEVSGKRITISETAGWNARASTFARRPDGTVFLVTPKPITIVDRHVPGGCNRFAGGRAWFEEVEYELPEGTRFGGTITVAYEDHVEVKDYSDTMPDGTPCGPPMID